MHQRGYTNEEFSQLVHSLQEERNLATIVLDTVDALVIVFDIHGNIIRFNKACEDLTGYTFEEVKGKHYTFFLANEEIEAVHTVFHQLTRGVQSHNENYWVTKKGRKRLISWKNSVLSDSMGAVKYVISTGIDITDKRLAEEKLLETQQELQDLLWRQQGIIFKIKKDETNRFIHTLCDGELLPLLGLSKDQIIGKELHEFLPKKHADHVWPFNEKAWNGEKTFYELEISGRNLLITLNPILIKNEVKEVIGYVSDITQLKVTEDLLRKSEKLVVVGQLAAGIAHEIRNPLTTIQGFMQLFQSGMVTQQDLGRYVNLILSELTRINEIVNEFLAVSHPHPQDNEYQHKYIQHIMEHVIRLLSPEALLKKVQITALIASDLPSLFCSENQLKQVFMNIIKNAIESMPNGGFIHIEVVREETNQVSIRCTDEGCGIPEKRLPFLGEPFYSLKEKGTGLGLMMCYRIIEAHRGKISITSQLGKGTTVNILLPLDNEKAGQTSSYHNMRLE